MATETARRNREAWPPKRVLCAGAVVLKEDKVLLVRQAQNASLAGQWSIPWGIVEQDEYPGAAAKREAREEGGVLVEIEGLLGLQNLAWQAGIGIIYLCRHLEGTPQPDGGQETDRAAYFSLEEIDTLKSAEPIEPWCEWLAKRVLAGVYTLIPPAPDSPYHPYPAFL